MVLVVKNLPAHAGDIRDACLIPGLGRSPGGGHGTLHWEGPLEEGKATHSSILAWRIPWTGVWQVTIHRVAKSQTQLKQLSTHAYILSFYFQSMYKFLVFLKEYRCF